MANKIKLRRDTSTNWTFVNPILAQAEPAYEVDTKRIKFGDGETPWRDLPYYDDVLSGNYITQAEFDSAIADVVGLSPETLNSLEELAQAINNDPDFLSSLQNDVDQKPDRSELSELAFTGNYSDLQGKPDLVDELYVSNAVSDEATARDAAIIAATSPIAQNVSILNTNLTAETTARTEAIEEEATARQNADNDLQADIDNEIARATDAETLLTNNLAAETTARTNADANLQTTIDGAVQDLTTAINLEATTRADNDADLQSSISTEIAARQNAVTQLTNSLNLESQTRSDADTVLQSNIDTEASIRAAADTHLQNQINFINENIDPAALDSLTEIVSAFNAGDSSIVSTVNNLQMSLQSSITDLENSLSSVATTGDYNDLVNRPQNFSEAGVETGYLELTNIPFITVPAELGTPVEFVRTASGTETDAIDEGLTLARSSQYALYNADAEAGYDNTNHTSPAGTEWNSDGWGDLLALGTRNYTTLREALGGAIGNNIIGAELIMHDTLNDKYYKFEFSDWGQNNGGSFAYTRTQVTDPNYFAKTNYGDQVDIIVPDDGEGAGVAITRGNNQGIYNPYREGSWDSNVSPGGTLWNIGGWDDLSDVETRVYTNFYDAYNGNLGNVVPGSKAVMFTPDTGKYYAVQWLSWTQGGDGGGFSYTRRELDLTKLRQGITFADGTVLTSAAGVGRVKSTASRGRRIEEVSGESTVSVTERNTVYLTTTASRTVTNEYSIWIANADTTIDEILNDPASYGITDNATMQFSLDNVLWYSWGGYGNNGVEMSINVNGGGPFTYNQGDTIYFKYDTGGAPVVWWDSNNLPSGGSNFRGAVIDYHAYTGEATWIGTMHIVDDNGDQNIAHTEVSSGSTDSENDDLWLVQNEGTISYRRIDGEAKTLKIHWTAKVFYGEEYYD